MIQLLGSALIIAAAMLADASALLYGTQFPWWTSGDGRHLFAYMSVIGGALTLWAGRLMVAGSLTGVSEAGVWPCVRLVVFAAIAWVLGWRLLIIFRAWREQRRQDAKEERS